MTKIKNRMLANFYVLHCLYKKAIREYKKGLSENPEDEFLKNRIKKLKQEVKKMNAQRKFKCTACEHEFEVPYGTGQRGHQINCPKCGAQVYRLDSGGGRRGGGFGGGRGQGGRCVRAGGQLNNAPQKSQKKDEKVEND